MKTTINLEMFLKMGGKLENLDIENTKTTYSDTLNGKKISKIILGQKSLKNVQLYEVHFKNDVGKNYPPMPKEYAPMWIETKVDMVLDSKFTK